jgi:archaeosortase A (PGF-CTERM-specific)
LFYSAYGLRPVGEALIEVVGGQTVMLLNLVQPGYAAGRVDLHPGDTELSMPVHWSGHSYIHIVIACTAIQALFVSVAFIGNVDAPWKRKALTLTVVAVPIYLLNLLRNVVVVYLVYNNITGFEFAHNVIGKVLISLVGLFTLMFLAFWLLPQMYEVINGLFDLPWRRGPGHDYKSNIGRLIDRMVPPRTNGRGG